jgi:hypothetical protein
MTSRSPSRTPPDSTTVPISSGTPRVDGLEERLLAFAEQLGRIAGTVQAKTAGWMDRDTLTKELARVRDGAADLLQQFTAGTPAVPDSKPTAGAAPGRRRGRSGGIVDAPGKKHRPPPPTGPGANRAATQAAKLRAAKTMVKTSRRRGRG